MKLFLLGMMGCGKSYWTKYLSRKMKIAGYDLDYLIESHEEKSIAEIFAEDGEAYFRKTEAKLLRWFGQKKTFVLATGGGTPCFENNMDWMNREGLTIWIDPSIDTLASRLTPEKSHRPLISGLSDQALPGFLSERLREREPFYAKASYRLTDNEINEVSFNKIIKSHA
ncbi:MAG TPA: shikimate kinase [Sediminibacterium sp.]|nr:shikimate kinase [Sediminibacterium sp.]